LRQKTLIRGRNAAPQIEFFFAPANKRLALAPDLIGIYFGFFFFFRKEKEKESPSRNNPSNEPPKRYLRKRPKKTKIKQIKKS
jgi:hypothetical protein